jgi:hypothetical protein
MRLVHTSLGKKLALQRVDGSPESAYRLPFGVLYELRGQNCTEKLIAAAIDTPVYESALLVGIGQEKRSPTVEALQDEEDRPKTIGDEGPLFGRIIGTRTGELTKGNIPVGIFANAVRNLSVFSFCEVSVKLRWSKDGIDENCEAELAAQIAHHLP